MFCLRIAGPASLVDVNGKTEIRTSLRTKGRREANRLIKTGASLLEEEFERHRRERDKQRHQGFWSRSGVGIRTRPTWTAMRIADKRGKPRATIPAVSATWTISGPAMRPPRTMTACQGGRQPRRCHRHPVRCLTHFNTSSDGASRPASTFATIETNVVGHVLAPRRPG